MKSSLLSTRKATHLPSATAKQPVTTPMTNVTMNLASVWPVYLCTPCAACQGGCGPMHATSAKPQARAATRPRQRCGRAPVKLLLALGLLVQTLVKHFVLDAFIVQRLGDLGCGRLLGAPNPAHQRNWLASIAACSRDVLRGRWHASNFALLLCATDWVMKPALALYFIGALKVTVRVSSSAFSAAVPSPSLAEPSSNGGVMAGRLQAGVATTYTAAPCVAGWPGGHQLTVWAGVKSCL